MLLLRDFLTGNLLSKPIDVRPNIRNIPKVRIPLCIDEQEVRIFDSVSFYLLSTGEHGTERVRFQAQLFGRLPVYQKRLFQIRTNAPLDPVFVDEVLKLTVLNLVDRCPYGVMRYICRQK